MSYRDVKEDIGIIENFCKLNNIRCYNYQDTCCTETMDSKYKMVKDSRDGDNITYCLFDINSDGDEEPLAEISVDYFDTDLNLCEKIYERFVPIIGIEDLEGFEHRARLITYYLKNKNKEIYSWLVTTKPTLEEINNSDKCEKIYYILKTVNEELIKENDHMSATDINDILGYFENHYGRYEHCRKCNEYKCVLVLNEYGYCKFCENFKYSKITLV